MKRKLIQLSTSTSVISLPRAWVLKNKLVKGEDLNVEETNNVLSISCSRERQIESSKEIDISELEGRMMWITIDAAYTAGYDSIVINTKDRKQSASLRDVVRFFPGMIIHEERLERVVFKDLSKGSRGDVDKILNRIFNLTINLFEDSLDFLGKKEWDSLCKVKELDHNINAYVSYCLRQINKFGYERFTKIGTIHTYTKVLEIMADKICCLFLGICEDRKIGSKEMELLGKLLDLYGMAQKLHFKFSVKSMVELEKKRQKLLESLAGINDHVKLYMTEVIELFFDLEQVEMQLHK
jgi:phosphate uptake regulator